MTIRETAQRLADALEAIPAYSIRERATFSGAVQLLRQWPEAGEPVAWRHDCAALLINDVELWIDACPHCGKPRTAATVPQADPVDQQVESINAVFEAWRNGEDASMTLALAAPPAAPGAAPSQQPAPARPDEFVCPHCFDEGAAPQAAQSGMVPVMWMHDAGDMITNAAWVQSSDRAKEWYHTPLVVVAPQAVPQPLTDEHVDEIWDGTFDSADPKRKLSFRQSITRAIERAHGIGITAKGDGNG